ncbi:glycosyltransferase family 4 protein [Rosenbergiella metrosideri]|uniref:glycosyltransferase family 4 protein n=1 Tax=Rosenbergiella metrosideri TaxID=2921185 RepID=UPI001F4FD962|nr:glycosyltransferase family 4 protein [Rosenbergiella metrosideri]
MKRKIIILHEYGAKDHYTALFHLQKKGLLDISEREFNLSSSLKKFIKKRTSFEFKRFLMNFFWLSKSFIFPISNKNITIILGIAPFDWKLILIKRITKYSNVVLHTSWTSWNDNFHPRKNIFLSSRIKSLWRNYILNCVSGVAAVTPTVKNEIIKFCENSLVEKKIEIVYHAIHDISDIQRIKKNDNLTVLFVGNIIEQKGINKIITISELNEDVMFKFIGKGKLSDSIEKSKSKNIEYLGYINNKKELYKNYVTADVIILPSLRRGKWEELFGIALAEAMYHGCVPLVTNHPGPATILSGSFLTKNIFTEDDFIDDASKEIKKMKGDPSYLSNLKREANMCASSFTAENISKAWMKLIEIEVGNVKDL